MMVESGLRSPAESRCVSVARFVLAVIFKSPYAAYTYLVSQFPWVYACTSTWCPLLLGSGRKETKATRIDDGAEEMHGAALCHILLEISSKLLRLLPPLSV